VTLHGPHAALPERDGALGDVAELRGERAGTPRLLPW